MLAELRWRYEHKLMWFQRERPVREFETRIYTGLPRSGKTLAMAQDVVKLMRAGVVVGSNIRIIDPVGITDGDNPNALPMEYDGDTSLEAREDMFGGVQSASGTYRLETRPVGGWVDILTLLVQALENGVPVVFAVDELHNIADAQAMDRVSPFVLWLLTQRRKFGCGMIGTTQDLEQVKKRVRALVDRVVAVRPLSLRWSHRLPFFQFSEINLRAFDVQSQGGDVSRKDIEARWEWGIVKWYAYASYGSWDLTAMESMASHKEDEVMERVQELYARAMVASQLYKSEPRVFVPERYMEAAA